MKIIYYCVRTNCIINSVKPGSKLLLCMFSIHTMLQKNQTKLIKVLFNRHDFMRSTNKAEIDKIGSKYKVKKNRNSKILIWNSRIPLKSRTKIITGSRSPFNAINKTSLLHWHIQLHCNYQSYCYLQCKPTFCFSIKSLCFFSIAACEKLISNAKIILYLILYYTLT